MRKYVKIVLGIILILLGIILFSLMQNTEEEDFNSKENENPLVATSLVQLKSIPFNLEVTGSLNAKNKIEIFSEVQGVLLPNTNPFKEGAIFQKGEYLLQLNDNEYSAQLSANKSTLMTQITAMLPDMEIEFPKASKKWESYLRTFVIEDPLQPLPTVTSDKEKFFVSGRGVFESYYNTKNQEERLKKYRIKAPFDGVVTEANVNQGTLIRNGQKLGEFVDPSIFELQLSIPASANNYITIGKNVQMTTLDSDQEFKSSILRINAKVDQATQSIRAIVEIKNNQLKDGQFLKAKIQGVPIKDAVKIKGSLLLENDQVYIIKDSTLVLQKIVQINYEKDSVVVKGLEEDMILLDEVLANAYPGMKISY